MPRTSRFLFIVAICLGLPFVAGLVLLALALKNGGDMRQASNQADAVSRSYRAAGLPWEATDLVRGPAISDRDNACELVRTLAEKTHGQDFFEILPKITSSMAKQDWASVERQLAPFDSAMNLGVAAAQKPDIDFHRDWDQGTMVLLPEYSAMRSVSRLLCLRAQIECIHRRVPEGVCDLAAAFRLGNLVGKEPILISLLAQIGIQRIAIETVSKCAWILRGNRHGLASLSSVVAECHMPDLNYVIRGEAYLGLATARNIRLFGGIKAIAGDPTAAGSGTQTIDLARLRRTGLPDDLLDRAYMARYLQIWVQLKQVIDRFHGNPVQTGKAMDAIVENVLRRRRPSYAYCAIAIPGYGQALSDFVSLAALKICSQAMLAAIRRDAPPNRYPTTIVDIPGTWIDPFNDKPLHVRRDAAGFRVYSVGPNHVDDGGVLRREAGYNTADYDVGVVYGPNAR